MPIKIPAALPARDVLTREGVPVIGDDDALRQDIRPLQIALLNLMPKKIQTETQFARLIGAGPLQIELTLVRMTEHESRNAPPEHMAAFYRPFAEARERKFDGLIITGAPIEHLAFEDVTYWKELEQVFEWTRTHVHSTFGVCWGGQAMLRHFHGVPKRDLGHKLFGVFEQRVTAPASPYLAGFSDRFTVPVSRWTEVREEDVLAAGVEVLAKSPASGLCLLHDPGLNALFMFNHLEYDADTLKQEYDRDVAAGTPITLPANYYPDDDPSLPPRNSWRSHAHLLYLNWINRIYQTTPYDIARIGEAP